MKILLVAPHYKPSLGGVQQYVEDLVEAYRDKHEIVVVTTQLNRQQPTHESVDGVTIYRLPVLMKLSNTPFHPRWKAMLRDIYRSESPDVINAHGPVPWFADVAQRATKGEIPFVLTYHSGSMKKGVLLPDIVIGLYERFVLPKTLKAATRLIAAYPEFLHRLAGTEYQVAYITPGINTDVFAPKRVDKTADVTFVGRIELTSEWKGLDVLLHAIAEVKNTRPTVSLQIVGTGDAVEKYTQLATELGIDANVSFRGALRDEQLIDAYRRSRIVVLPSKTESESFGMVLAEAQACGVAVIGSRVGGIPNVIEENKTGLLVPPGQSEPLAEAVRTLLKQDKRRKAFGEAGALRVRTLFSRTRLIQETEKILIAATKRRIVHVSSNYPPRLGGLENVVRELATEQYGQGDDVRVVTSRLGYRNGYQDSVPVKRLGAVEVAHTPLIPGLFRELLHIEKRDVVHVHVAQAFVPEVVGLASRIKRFRYVAHVHLDIAPSGPVGWLLKVYKPLFLGPMLRRAAYVVVFTEEQKRLMVEKYRLQQERVIIIPNGVAAEFYYASPRALHTPARLLFVGRLSFQKNLPLLLNALDGVSNQFDTRIVGDGDLRGEYDALARELKLENVHFYGRKDGAELHQQYQEADVFVLPSEREGMPLVLLEAMAKALPIVGTDVTGTRDVVVNGTTGRLVPFGDEKAFRKALIEVTEDNLQYGTMSRATLREAEQYSWSKVAKRFKKLYED